MKRGCILWFGVEMGSVRHASIFRWNGLRLKDGGDAEGAQKLEGGGRAILEQFHRFGVK